LSARWAQLSARWARWAQLAQLAQWVPWDPADMECLRRGQNHRKIDIERLPHSNWLAPRSCSWINMLLSICAKQHERHPYCTERVTNDKTFKPCSTFPGPLRTDFGDWQSYTLIQLGSRKRNHFNSTSFYIPTAGLCFFGIISDCFLLFSYRHHESRTCNICVTILFNVSPSRWTMHLVSTLWTVCFKVSHDFSVVFPWRLDVASGYDVNSMHVRVMACQSTIEYYSQARCLFSINFNHLYSSSILYYI
jgi:hypothetical protein